jgi:hypothetical protein
VSYQAVKVDIFVWHALCGFKIIDGLEVYRRISEHHPGEKAVIAGGFSETERVKEAKRLGAGAYVKKPYELVSIQKWALFRDLCVNLRDFLCGVLKYASAQSLNFLDLAEKGPFLNWKLQLVPPEVSGWKRARENRIGSKN